MMFLHLKCEVSSKIAYRKELRHISSEHLLNLQFCLATSLYMAMPRCYIK